MTKPRFILLASLLALTSSHARAQATQMPNYDVASFCGSRTDERDCVNRQYLHRTIAGYSWYKITEKERAECVSVNKWSDYIILNQCVGAHEVR